MALGWDAEEVEQESKANRLVRKKAPVVVKQVYGEKSWGRV